MIDELLADVTNRSADFESLIVAEVVRSENLVGARLQLVDARKVHPEGGESRFIHQM